MEAASTVKGDRIWLIAPDWQVRALVRAQLLEEGYDVTAVEDWGSLQALLQEEEVVAPGLEERHQAGILRAVRACLIHNTLLGGPSIEIAVNASALAQV